MFMEAEIDFFSIFFEKFKHILADTALLSFSKVKDLFLHLLCVCNI